MALIRTIQEAKAALPRVLSNLSNSAAMPNTTAAEYKYLVPLIGLELYTDIDTKINNVPPDTLTDKETSLLALMRSLVTIYAYLDDLGTDNAKITDGGIRSTETANIPRVFGWQYKELKNTLLSKAADATEVLLTFLFANKGDFTKWTDSNEYKSASSFVIKTGSDFNLYYTLFQPMRSYYALKNLMDEVQDDFIRPSIGKELLQWFVDQEMFNENQRSFVKYLKRAIAYMTIKKACEHYSVRFDANGFTIVSQGGDTENPETAGRSNSDIQLFEKKMFSCLTDAQEYLNKAKKQIIDYYNSLTGGSSGEDDFIQAFEESPLVDYKDPVPLDRGNDNRTGVVRL